MASPRGQATIADGTGEVQLGSTMSIAAVAPSLTTGVELTATIETFVHFDQACRGAPSSLKRGLRARANFSPTITKSPPRQGPNRATHKISLLTDR